MAVKINVTQVLTDFSGAPISGDGAGQPLTLRDVCIRALMTPPEQGKLDGKEQVGRYEMARSINSEDVVELSNAEAGKIQGLIAEVYAPLVTGQSWLMLEGGNALPDETAE